MDRYCKRLIEVDLPIKRISAHARREKSIRHGHISTLHIWWARRPLAACRAVICASLWLDPADKLCPDTFRNVAKKQMINWAKNHIDLVSEESWSRFVAISKDEHKLDDLTELRSALLDFIADFANWDNSTVPEYLETSRLLTQTAHEALGGEPGSRPLVVDPFAGGGSIPLEALRVGAEAFASDLNPVAVLLNKVMLEYIPKHGKKLADEVRKWGQWIKEEAEKKLSKFYPKDPDGATPIAYLWARTIICEGPGCGTIVPLLRSLWLARKQKKSVALKLIPKPKAKRIDFEIIENASAKEVGEGTVARGSASCPCCGYTTPVESVRKQLKTKRGGANNARLFCVVTTSSDKTGRFYRAPTERDIKAIRKSAEELEHRKNVHTGTFSLVPDENISHEGTFRILKPLIYGAIKWEDLYTHRQLLCLTTLIHCLRRISDNEMKVEANKLLAIKTCLAFAIDRQADYLSSFTIWSTSGEFIAHTFGRQALPIVWEWPECQPFSGGSGNWIGAIEWIAKVIESWPDQISTTSNVEKASATLQILPNDSANALFTDPPYYSAIAYASLSDYFYVWLKRSIGEYYPDLFSEHTVNRNEEIIVDMQHEKNTRNKDISFYEQNLTKAFFESRRVCKPEGLGIIVFASKTTSSWEAILQAVLEGGWIILGSWPIDTEREARVSALGQARLGSSVHLVCRPRENPDGSLSSDDIGDWRDVLSELPKRIHEWMPRLAREGVVGADAIFACLGPALEIYSRFSSVEKASGEKVELKEYLEEVWAAVSREALNMIFEGADASGFEEDARLTAMWLWTLRTAINGNNGKANNGGSSLSLEGYNLEYDAARKIAQGLGAHLEKLSHLVEIKGNTAMLFTAGSRTRYLFGKDATNASRKTPKKKTSQLQLDFENEFKQAEDETGEWAGILGGKAGSTVLDQLHQSMILFAAGRGEAMKRFLIEEGVGRNPLFWRLAQAFSALYPTGTDDKRWVDGVLARKKGLGF